MTLPKYLNPFVVPVETRASERHGAVDLYLPDAAQPRPAVVFVHGGPISTDLRPTPREWPVYRGYGSLAAARGVVGVTVDHRFHWWTDLPLAATEVAAAVELARADPRVDADRVVLWFFSGGGLLLADWLRTRPAWLRAVAASYPMLAPPAAGEVDPRFQPAQAVTEAGDLPVVLTRVDRERPSVAATVETFVQAARTCGARLEIIDVPNGQHSFDHLDHTDESRNAVDRAFDSVLTTLN